MHYRINGDYCVEKRIINTVFVPNSELIEKTYHVYKLLSLQKKLFQLHKKVSIMIKTC